VRWPWRRRPPEVSALQVKIAELGKRAAVLDELATAERQNAATQAENLRLLKALTAAEERADQWRAEATAARVELAARIGLDRYRRPKYADKLCPGCDEAADDDMNNPDPHPYRKEGRNPDGAPICWCGRTEDTHDADPDQDVLTTDLTAGHESVWPSDPTEQEPR
jgi:hypothetical protein